MLQHLIRKPTILRKFNKLHFKGNCIAFIRKKTVLKTNEIEHRGVSLSYFHNV